MDGKTLASPQPHLLCDYGKPVQFRVPHFNISPTINSSLISSTNVPSLNQFYYQHNCKTKNSLCLPTGCQPTERNCNQERQQTLVCGSLGISLRRLHSISLSERKQLIGRCMFKFDYVIGSQWADIPAQRV